MGFKRARHALSQTDRQTDARECDSSKNPSRVNGSTKTFLATASMLENNRIFWDLGLFLILSPWTQFWNLTFAQLATGCAVPCGTHRLWAGARKTIRLISRKSVAKEAGAADAEHRSERKAGPSEMIEDLLGTESSHTAKVLSGKFTLELQSKTI